MKIYSYALLVVLMLVASQPIFSQNKKFDKSLSKIDARFNAGSFSKASSGLQSLKKSVVAKMGQQNTYMPGLYIREARITLALGMFEGFDKALENALASSLATFGENSANYASTMIDVAEVYNEYGNYRISREYCVKAREQLTKTNQLNDNLNARIGLVEGEAMTGQGFCNDAIALFKGLEKYYASRAVDKETKVDGTSIKTQRVPDAEIPGRFTSYSKLLMLTSLAYSKKGSTVTQGLALQGDSAFMAATDWTRKNQKYMGETSLALEQTRYYHAKMLMEHGTQQKIKKLEFDDILNNLKKKSSPTTALAHDLYIAYLHELLVEENRARYLNTKLEYEKMIDKNFPKGSAFHINLKAVEFDSKLERDKTKDLEQDASNLLNSKALPKYYATRIRILNFLFEIAQKEKRYTNSEKYLTQIADITKELCGETSPDYHLARIRLASYYLDYTNKIEEAQKIFDESFIKIVSKEIGPFQKDHLDILNHLAILYEMSDKYSDANKILDRASEVGYSKYSNKDPDYGRELDRIAQLQIKLGQYEKADQNITKAIGILEEYRKEDKNIGHYIHAIETQAKLYGVKGMFDEAEANLERSRKLIKNADVAIGSDLSSAEELTSLFIQLGRYSDANRLLDNQIPEYENLYGKTSLRLIEPLVNRGRVLLANGEYTEAEQTATNANQMALKIYGDVSTKTAPTQKLLSDIYFTLGDYDKAEATITKALASQEKQFGRDHIEVARSLSQLALIKFYKGDDKKEVEKMMVEARDIIEKRLKKDNPLYAEIMKNMAVLYISEKKFDAAFNSLTVAEGIWKAKTGTKNNVNAASIYTLTGDVYYQQKNYKKAEDFYNQSKALYEKFFSTKHPEYVKVLSKLGKVYYMQKDYKRSKKFIEESLLNYENFIKSNFPALGENQKAKYWNMIKGDFEFYNTLAFSNLDDFKDLTGKIYNYQLLTKALLLSTSIKIRERILNSTDEELKSMYRDWVAKKEVLTLALSMSPQQLAESDIDPNGVQQEVERLEKELSKRSELFGQNFENKRIEYEDVKKSLKPNETAIEMVRYRYFNHDFTDSVIYAALFLKPEFSRPKAIMLNDGKKMETRFFKFYRNAIIGKVKDEVSYGVFWKPIIDAVGQSSTIYLSAEGIYNQINLEAIPTPDGKYIIDNANIVLVSNTKDLYLRKLKPKSASDNTATLFGNPSFYLTADASQSIAQLPGTEKEVTQVQYMLKQKGYTTTEYIEGTASEENLKSINSPKVLYVATHGFYRPTTQATMQDELAGSEAALLQNPLMRSGLLLKGAGDLLGKTNYNFNMENGILTAQEAMSLNLDKTLVVIASACETGLGDLEAGEGVQGLQRAFLVAGSSFLIISMFKVDDDATQKLMVSFWQKYLNNGNMRQSFIDAKKELRTDYPEPIYWGAFMLIGLD